MHALETLSSDSRVAAGAVTVDPITGLLSGLRIGDQPIAVGMRAAVVQGGSEVQNEPYVNPFEYVDTERLTEFRLDGAPLSVHHGDAVTHRVATSVGPWSVEWSYRFGRRFPALELAIAIAPAAAGDSPALRDLQLTFEFALPDRDAWRLAAPGNQLRADVAPAEMSEVQQLLTAGGAWGSTGLIAMHREAPDATLVFWPFCRTEVGRMDVSTTDEGVRIELATRLAGRLDEGECLQYESILLDGLGRPWERLRRQIPDALADRGVVGPSDTPAWFPAANILEVHFGTTAFEGAPYAPYPTVADLASDLPRIRELGFDVIEIMPRQPYPSYAVHDFTDIDTTYGDEEALRRLVAQCHALGIRVLLDVVLHGVIDREVARLTKRRIEAGPSYAQLDTDLIAPFGGSPSQRLLRNIAWSRRMLEEIPAWLEHAPERHPLVDEKPEWFLRDSRQEIIGIYTRGLDAANLEFQDHFVEAAVGLVGRLDADGLRIDAPHYNQLPNWSEATRTRASYSPLGAVDIFPKLRRRLREVKRDAAMYTEPGGVLWRPNVDATYNYDEHWLIDAVLRPHASDHGPAPVRNGRELAAWFSARDEALPRHSLITRHIDSHDTMWWPLPGAKWRREQYGLDATRALLSVFSLSGGPFMTYVGGEEGLEEELRRVHRLRREMPAIRDGVADYDHVAADDDHVYAVARVTADELAVIVVNLSADRVRSTLGIDGLRRPSGWYDAWGDEPADDGLALTLEPYQTRVLVPSGGRAG